MKKNKSAEIGTLVLINLDTNEVLATSFSSYRMAAKKYEKWLADDIRCHNNVKEISNTEYTYSAGGNRHRCVLVKSDIFNHYDGYAEEQLRELDF